jgi:hypothetical protein
MMAQESMNALDELQQLRRRFEEFRNAQTSRGRLPEPLWKEAAELAARYGLNPTARALRLDYNGLKKRMEVPDRSKRHRKGTAAPAFVELVGPVPGGVTNCSVEVESGQGAKLRLDLKGVATTELASLIRAFIGQ